MEDCLELSGLGTPLPDGGDGAVCVPGGGCALPGLRYCLELSEWR